MIGVFITCSEFTDVNGGIHKCCIPAIKLFGEGIDTTPPASVTGLNESKAGQKYINWSWENPQDDDFAGVKIDLNDIFVGDLEGGKNWYNATNLTPDSLHKIGVQTFDNNGNLNLY